MKKMRFQHPSNRMLIFILVLVLGLNAAVLWFYGQKLNILWQQNGNGSIYRNNNSGGDSPVNSEVKFYIHTAIKSLYNSRPSTDPVGNKVYFPEARIYVPYSDYARTIVYRFDAAQNGVPASGTFTSSFNTNMLPSTFADVPCLQRHVSLLVNSRIGGDGAFVSSVKLADGRTLNLYKQDTNSCNGERWSQGAPDKLVDLLKQAKSY